MDRKAAINFARAGAQKLWAGTVTIKPDAKTGAHHHGHLESIIYVVKGKARMRWGEHLQFTAEAGPGDFIFVPPYVPHQEINASRDEVLECVLVRSDGEAVAINLDIEPVEKPETCCGSIPCRRTHRVCRPSADVTHPPEGTYRHTRVGGPRTQQCGDARTWSKRQPRRCWELQADRTVVCGTQAWSLYPCFSLFRLRASSTVHAGPHGHGDTPGVPHALLGQGRQRNDRRASSRTKNEGR
jgi:uncharacterized RmlC-like cupin family protein